MIELKNVSIKYIKDFFTIYNLNCKIEGNTIFLGDEFLGSVSLMRLLSKIDKPTAGNIYIDGKNLWEIKDKDLSISYIPKEPYLLNKSIEKNLMFPLKIRKVNKVEAKNRVDSLISAYNLSNFPKKIKEMSFSEKKIICLVRTLARAPKYVLLEHFFENLDQQYLPLATKILHELEKSSTIIACEKTLTKPFETYTQIELKN